MMRQDEQEKEIESEIRSVNERLDIQIASTDCMSRDNEKKRKSSREDRFSPSEELVISLGSVSHSRRKIRISDDCIFSGKVSVQTLVYLHWRQEFSK